MRTIQSAGTPSTRIAIGLWHPDRHYGAGLPHPQSLVSPGWEPQRRPQIVESLRAGHAVRGNGLRFCIFGCRSVAWARTDDPTKGMRKPELDDESEGPPGFWIAIDCCYTTGWVELSDGVWLWPDGLAHDVEAHGVRLPDEFVAHAAARDFRPPKPEPESNGDFVVQHEFWTDWCRKNARFEYEPNCVECERPDSSLNPRGGRGGL